MNLQEAPPPHHLLAFGPIATKRGTRPLLLHFQRNLVAPHNSTFYFQVLVVVLISRHTMPFLATLPRIICNSSSNKDHSRMNATKIDQTELLVSSVTYEAFLHFLLFSMGKFPAPGQSIMSEKSYNARRQRKIRRSSFLWVAYIRQWLSIQLPVAQLWYCYVISTLSASLPWNTFSCWALTDLFGPWSDWQKTSWKAQWNMVPLNPLYM